ncbi:3-oxoacyl-ACP reductase [Rhodococcus kronopolitis]|uniref:3-oxoacyl-ACP reductase n=1 Tax=Rhodococcus kronopolitis TaxID=1460226 RepID=A0ABV9FSI2_9NOCA
MGETVSLEGRTAVITGAGAGLGKAEALALAEAGAAVVVNDMGDAAHAVAEEIRAAGGQAIGVTGDVSDWTLGGRMIEEAVKSFGSFDILVNNAGILRDKMVFNLTEADWDDVLRVHLKGHAATSVAAAQYWRNLSKESGGPVYGRVINTSSEAFLFGSAGQPNYSAAKAGITALTLSTSQGLSRYGVTANAICPRARTAMTAEAFGEAGDLAGALDPLAPERVGTLVSYLASPASHEITGQVFVVYGKMVALMAAPQVENRFDAAGSAFTVNELDEQLSSYFVGRGPYETYAAYGVAELEKPALAIN